MNIQIINPKDQATGEFDGGKITEQKPIGFSGEGSIINRLGPLFYWAWGHAHEPGGIGFHPHKGFEIMTYVINGTGYHKDTLGTESKVGAGGVQLMQAGSGLQHAESLKEPAELLQIWFEPYLSDAVKRAPSYSKYVHEDFPFSDDHGITVKTVLGKDSPIHLFTDAAMFDVKIAPGGTYKHVLAPNVTLGGLAIRGGGTVVGQQVNKFAHKDFVVIESGQGEEFTIQADDLEELRVILIEVPTEVNYTLYNKPR